MRLSTLVILIVLIAVGLFIAWKYGYIGKVQQAAVLVDVEPDAALSERHVIEPAQVRECQRVLPRLVREAANHLAVPAGIEKRLRVLTA